MPIRVGRIADSGGPGERRVLADRLWPRGVRKTGAPWDLWIPEVAPTTALRRWYGHDPNRFGEFRERYWEELSAGVGTEPFARLAELARVGPLRLLTATRDLKWSHVHVLADFLRTLEEDS